MNRKDLVKGRKYARREKFRDHGCPLEPVVYGGIAKSGQVKVRHLEGDLAGLEEWVPTAQIVCPWGGRNAVLRDEQRLGTLLEKGGSTYSRMVTEAISEVMTASGYSGGFTGRWWDEPDVARQMWSEAGLAGDPLEQPYAFIDRQGTAHFSYDTAHRWARAFAAEQPARVSLYLDGQEEGYTNAGFNPGDRHLHEFLRTQMPVWAMVRGWCGSKERDALHAQVDRLRVLVNRAIGELRSAGAEDAARRIERALAGG